MLTATSSAQQVFGVPWSDALTAIGTTLAVVVALLLGFWVNGLSSWIFRPRLKASIEAKLPDCHVVDFGSWEDEKKFHKVSEQYYCRLRITNGGWFCTSARDVELLLDRLWDVKPSPSVEVLPFLPLNLTWAHVVPNPLIPERHTLKPLIQPQVFRHCDLCHVDSRYPNQLRFNAHTKPNPINGQLSTTKPAGSYELDLILVGANYAPQFVTVRIEFTGKWPAGTKYTSLLDVRVVRQSSKAPKKHPV